ncbi:glycosyltransferase family 4 protein [Altererythrobacter sp. BO-6]|uniref:glycosyltransferase family 4 protein n=1 Tax=Altererythrobacter sp. BO-6 TaxID=2604537 RepID=UPI0013E108F1|nr:glycosyltransferase family 4 protein [Altererythrobacter sp. BO-6]QIG54269.1 glycosyltransferase family 4 protein [Altererythrobacter sp. BO-6]
MQTKEMMRAFSSFSNNLHWFPTARRNYGANYRGGFANGEYSKLRCLFLGHVSKAKGIMVAAQAANTIPNIVLDVYGPLIDVDTEDFVNESVEYRGIVEPNEVHEIFAAYDVLLFPTSHPGEGYSGTLVEAAMAGLPIIASRWQSLPEMFADDEAIFIDAVCVDQLVAALRAIIDRPEDLHARSHRLVERSKIFDADRVFGDFLAACRKLTLNKRT